MPSQDESWKVAQVDRKGMKPILTEGNRFSISPGTQQSGPITVKLPGVSTDLQGTCVREGKLNWIQASCQEGKERYVLCAFPRPGDLLEGFVLRIKRPDVNEDPQDTETWTATKPPTGGGGPGQG